MLFRSAEAVAAPPAGESILARHARRDAVRLDFRALAPELLLDLIRHGRSAVVIAPPAGLAEALAGEPVEIMRAAPEGG